MKMTMVRDLLIDAGQLAQRLAHQAGLEAGQGIAHLAFQFRARHQCGDAVDHQHVQGAGAHQRVGDFERLLARVGLGDQEIADLDAELPRISRVERVFGVDKGSCTAGLLRLSDNVQGKRGLAGAFRAINFDHAPARHAADAKRNIEADRAGRDDLGLDNLVIVAEPHDGAFAEGTLNLAQSGIEGFCLVHVSILNQAER